MTFYKWSNVIKLIAFIFGVAAGIFIYRCF